MAPMRKILKPCPYQPPSYSSCAPLFPTAASPSKTPSGDLFHFAPLPLKPPIQRIYVYIASYVPDSSVEAILLQPASKSVGPNVFNSKRFLLKHAETMIKQCAEMMTKHCEMHERTANDALSQASASLTGPAHTSEGMPMMR